MSTVRSSAWLLTSRLLSPAGDATSPTRAAHHDLPTRTRDRAQLPEDWKKATTDALGNGGSFPDSGFSVAWHGYCSYLSPAMAATARRERLAGFLSQLISRPPRRDRVLDLSYCAELTATDFAAIAHVPKARRRGPSLHSRAPRGKI